MESDEYAAIVTLLKKRHYTPVTEEADISGLSDEPGSEDRQELYKQAQKERDRQLRYLASKGFSYSAVRFVFDHWDELA